MPRNQPVLSRPGPGRAVTYASGSCAELKRVAQPSTGSPSVLPSVSLAAD
jgi:hypothetical protein